MPEPIAEADLLNAIAGVVKREGGTIARQDSHVVTGTLTAIESKWFFGRPEGHRHGHMPARR
jgi:hypothetical protein